jgi:hypothetical protein
MSLRDSSDKLASVAEAVARIDERTKAMHDRQEEDGKILFTMCDRMNKVESDVKVINSKGKFAMVMLGLVATILAIISTFLAFFKEPKP